MVTKPEVTLTIPVGCLQCNCSIRERGKILAFIPMALAFWLCAATSIQAEPLRVRSAVLRWIDEVDVPAQESGVLTTMGVREGQQVREDDEVARVDDAQAQLLQRRSQCELESARKQAASDVALRSAREAATMANAELRRAQEARRQMSDSVSQSELDRLQFEVRKAALALEKAVLDRELAAQQVQVKESEWELASLNLSRRKISAPLAGVVAEVYRQRGEWVEPGESIVRIVRMDRLRADGFADIRNLRDGLLGSDAEVVADLPGQGRVQFRAEVTYVASEVDPVSGQVRIWAEVDNPNRNLRPGMRVELTINDKLGGGDLAR